MSSIADTWLARIGPQATATLERAVFLSRCGGAGVVLMIPLFWFFDVRQSDVGMGVTFIGLLLGPTAFFARSVYL